MGERDIRWAFSHRQKHGTRFQQVAGAGHTRSGCGVTMRRCHWDWNLAKVVGRGRVAWGDVLSGL